MSQTVNTKFDFVSSEDALDQIQAFKEASVKALADMPAGTEFAVVDKTKKPDTEKA